MIFAKSFMICSLVLLAQGKVLFLNGLRIKILKTKEILSGAKEKAPGYPGLFPLYFYCSEFGKLFCHLEVLIFVMDG